MANDNQPDKVIYSMHRVTKRHGQREVLKDISLGYFYGAKIGVLGLNGAGKSSLLKIMAGVDKAFDGDVVVAPGYSIGYLEQEPLVDETRTVREVVEEGVQEIVDLVKEFNEINEKFADPDADMDALIERQAKVQEKMDATRKHREAEYERLIDAVYPKRGWTLNGVPTVAHLKELGMDLPELLEVVEPLQDVQP